MTSFAIAALVLLGAYLIGAIPFGYVVAWAKGVNIFEHGSGNIGATNVGRVLGRKYGILVFVLDLAKGAVPAAVASWLAPRLDLGFPPDSLPVGAGLAAFLGHLFPVYLGFRGGKGVATGAGVVLVLLPIPAAGALLIWLGVALASRYVSLASVLAAAGLCGLRLWLTPRPFAADHAVLSGFCVVAAVLVLIRHQSNLARLVAGTESQLKETGAMLTLTKTIHVLALGLWFGMAVFFSFVVALSLFGTFDSAAQLPAAERPSWFPSTPVFDQDDAARKEQGTRAAGAVISPLFDWYFLIQGVCGFLAVATSMQWAKEDRVHRIRTLVLLLALVTVVAGWPLERKVSELRLERHRAIDAVLQSKEPPSEATRAAAAQMRSEFGKWHGYSTLLNLGTLLFVTVGMALAAQLPAPSRDPAHRPES